jgi:hypothetical protein
MGNTASVFEIQNEIGRGSTLSILAWRVPANTRTFWNLLDSGRNAIIACGRSSLGRGFANEIPALKKRFIHDFSKL